MTSARGFLKSKSYLNSILFKQGRGSGVLPDSTKGPMHSSDGLNEFIERKSAALLLSPLVFHWPGLKRPLIVQRIQTPRCADSGLNRLWKAIFLVGQSMRTKQYNQCPKKQCRRHTF